MPASLLYLPGSVWEAALCSDCFSWKSFNYLGVIAVPTGTSQEAAGSEPTATRLATCSSSQSCCVSRYMFYSSAEVLQELFLQHDEPAGLQPLRFFSSYVDHNAGRRREHERRISLDLEASSVVLTTGNFQK
ncbi:hypothetical protein EYF80_060464 [Liparis tanakae]|uniref:Uncharacterized protein n=1 Tax=Liparis tanakae TaxID=230148 RepID=A0A4Z2EKZ3_9TELE|nr:hypothetical protein EYF80_060464 [Liparis tanakae]